VVRVATKGGKNWATLYRLAYSADCVTFINLLDGAGKNQVHNIIMIMPPMERSLGDGVGWG